VLEVGAEVTRHSVGDRVGVGCLVDSCGECEPCKDGMEMFCTKPSVGTYNSKGYDGEWTMGGYAQEVVVSERMVLRIPDALELDVAAPLLCAGIIGYRCLRLVGIVGDDARLPGVGATGAASGGAAAGGGAASGDTAADDTAAGRPRLGLYGFGSAAHLCTQVALWRGWEVYAFTRDEEHRSLARELGAAWAGETWEDPGVLLDAAIVFAPAGELAVDALRRLDKGGIVALGGIYSSPIPPIDYPSIYHERVVRSVANSTRQDARELLRDAALIPVVSRVQEYELEQANEALLDLKEDRVRGSAVLRVS